MKFSDHLIILSTIFLGFWLDNSLNPLTIKFFLELNFGFLIYTYWVFAMPEKLQSSAALFYGLVIDLFFSNVIGFNMLFFVATSYVIHLYVFRFRIFSYFFPLTLSSLFPVIALYCSPSNLTTGD